MYKKHYSRLITERVHVNLQHRVLAGSLTKVQVVVNEVEVHPFESGFAEEFKEISFD